MAEPMTLQIITPDAIVFEGKSTFFVGKAIDSAITHRSTRWNIS